MILVARWHRNGIYVHIFGSNTESLFEFANEMQRDLMCHEKYKISTATTSFSDMLLNTARRHSCNLFVPHGLGGAGSQLAAPKQELLRGGSSAFLFNQNTMKRSSVSKGTGSPWQDFRSL